MANYLDIPTASLAAGKPLTTALALRFRDNPIALYENTVASAWLTGDQTESAGSFTDLTDWNITAKANSVWRVHYACDVRIYYDGAHAPFYGVYQFKVYAASLAATPGKLGWMNHTFPLGVAWRFAVDSGTVGDTLSMRTVATGLGARTHEQLHIDGIVYVGSSDTTIKYAFRSNNSPAGITTKIYAGSVMLAQEISGSI